MALDANIILQGRPPQINDPLQEYGRMLSLKGMQQQQAQEAQLAPLRQQREQMQVQDMQRQMDEKDAIAQIAKKYYGDNPATTPPSAPPAAPQSPAAAPSPAVIQPGSSLQATDPATGPYDTPKTADMPEAVDPNAPPSPSAPYAASALGNSAAPGYSAPAPAPTAPAPTAPAAQTALPQSPDAGFLREMSARGYGPAGAKYIQDRAIAQESQMKVAQMQRDQQDAEIWGRASNKAGGDPEKALAQAAADGMSPTGLGALRLNLNKMIDERIKQRKDLSEAQQQEDKTAQEKKDVVATRMAAFNKRPDDDSDQSRAAMWGPFLASLHTDGYMNDAEYAQTLTQFKAVPDKATVQQIIDNHASQSYIDKQADIREKQQKADQQAQLALNTKIGAATSKAEYNKILSDNQVPPGTYPPAEKMFDPTGKPIASAFSSLDRRGMTPDQRTMADERAMNESRQDAHDKTMERIAQENADTNKNRAGNTAAGQTANLQGLMNKVWTDTVAAKGAGGTTPESVTPADAVAYLKDPERWGDDENVSAKRTALIAAFSKANKGDLDQANETARTANTQANTDKTKSATGLGPGLQLAKDTSAWLKAHPGQPKPDDATVTAWGGSQRGAAAPPAATAVKPPVVPPPAAAPKPAPTAAPPPPPKTGSFSLHLTPELSAKFGGKKVLVFPDEASANKFAAAAGLSIGK